MNSMDREAISITDSNEGKHRDIINSDYIERMNIEFSDIYA